MTGPSKVQCHAVEKDSNSRAGQYVRNRTEYSPTKILGPDTVPPTGVSHALYLSNEAKRIAILGTIPVTTAPRPGVRVEYGISDCTIVRCDM